MEIMNGKDIITLGLGLQAPWEIKGQVLDMDKNPHELRLTSRPSGEHGILARSAARFATPMISRR